MLYYLLFIGLMSLWTLLMLLVFLIGSFIISNAC